MRPAIPLVVLTTLSLHAQEPLSLRQAIDLALEENPQIAAAGAGEREADSRIRQARSGYLPSLSFSESLQRSNNPVFVFGSLLMQHQFTAANFALGPLNRPEALNNYQSRLMVEQVLYDAGRTRRGVEAARFTRQMAGEEARRSHSEVILAVVRTYFAAVLAAKNLEVAQQSLQGARADLERAEAIFESGRSTRAEVLAVRVHLAATQEQRIRAANEMAVARAALNDAMGVSLDRSFELTTPLDPRPGAHSEFADYRKAAGERAERRQAELARRLAETEQRAAESAYWPEVVFQGAVEADRQSVFNRGGANWLTAVSLRWNLWNGSQTQARIEQARFRRARAEAQLERVDSAIELEVRKSYLDLGAAGQRIEVASAAVAEAEEAHRIIRNRYEAGLTTVTELLRSDTALAAARTRRLSAIHDHRIAAATLEHAAGNLTAASPALD